MSRVNVFVLIDALGWELVAQRPFLAQYLPHQQEVRTLLGYSSGIIPSILTGQTPAENGVWNLVYYDPARSPFRHMKHLGTLPGRLLDNRYGRRARSRGRAARLQRSRDDARGAALRSGRRGRVHWPWHA
jgi:hypothetical protein